MGIPSRIRRLCPTVLRNAESSVSYYADVPSLTFCSEQNDLKASLTFPEGHSVDKVEFPVGLFINNEYSPAANGETIEVRSPANDKVIAHVPAGQPEDVDRAVEAAQKAYDTVWGERCPGRERGRLLMKLADLFEEHVEQLASIEAMVRLSTYPLSF